MFSFSYKEDVESPNERRVLYEIRFEKRSLLNSNSLRQ